MKNASQQQAASKKEIKQQALVLRKILAERGVAVSSSTALDCVSRLLGEREWNALAAKLKPEVKPKKSGLRITGTVDIEEGQDVRTIDVTAWFEQADDGDIAELAEEGFGEEVAGNVFQFLVDNEQLDAMLAVEALDAICSMFPKADVQHTFCIDKAQVKAWLTKHNPELLDNLGDSDFL